MSPDQTTLCSKQYYWNPHCFSSTDNLFQSGTCTTGLTGYPKGLDLRKTVNSCLPIFLAYVVDAQKNCLIETVLLSTQSICFA